MVPWACSCRGGGRRTTLAPTKPGTTPGLALDQGAQRTGGPAEGPVTRELRVARLGLPERGKDGANARGSPVRDAPRTAHERHRGVTSKPRSQRPARPRPRYLHRRVLAVRGVAPDGGVERPERVPSAAAVKDSNGTAGNRATTPSVARVERGAPRAAPPAAPGRSGGDQATKARSRPPPRIPPGLTPVPRPRPPPRRILPQQRLHLGAGVGPGRRRRRLLGLLHEPVLVVLVDVEAAEAGRERAPRHAAGPDTHRNRNRNAPEPERAAGPPRPAPPRRAVREEAGEGPATLYSRCGPSRRGSGKVRLY